MRREVRTVVGLCVLICAAILRSDNTSLARRLRHGEIRLHGDGELAAMVLSDFANAGKINCPMICVGQRQFHVRTVRGPYTRSSGAMIFSDGLPPCPLRLAVHG